jgi:hypothetical protein
LLWGPMGLVLAIPVTVIFAVLGRHLESFALFEVLLGAAPALSPADRFYQRILAGDPEEAADQASDQLKVMTLAQYYDTVVMEALKKAVRDGDAGRLQADRFGQIKESIDVFIEEMAEVDEKTIAASERADEVPTDAVADGGPMILCVAAKSKLDEAAAAMLVQLLQGRGLKAVAASASDLAAGFPSADMVCLSAFDAGDRNAHVKFLLKRLRRQIPTAQYLGCFWRLDNENPVHKAVIGSIGADDIASTLSAAVERCILQRHGVPLVEKQSTVPVKPSNATPAGSLPLPAA